MTDQPQIPVAETNLAVGVHLIKPKSIKYFEYTAYISIGVSICLMIGEYVALYYFQHNSKTFSWSAFAVSIQPIVEGIFGLLFIWWFVIKKHANWARWLLLLSILVLLLGSIGGFFVAVTQAGFVYTLSLLSPSLMASFILSSLMLYFLFTSASNEWFNVSKETHEDSRVDSAKTSLEVQSFWVRPRTIKALDFSTMWSKVIQKTNNVFLIVFLVFTFPFLYEAHFEVSNLYSGIGIIMVFLLILWLLCYFVENFMIRQRISGTISTLDTKLYFLILVRNFIFLLTFIFIIGLKFMPGAGFLIWIIILFFPVFLVYFIGFLISYIGLLIARSRDVKKSNLKPNV